MLIRCPKCEICYRIDADMIPAEGRKFRCARCGEVWLAKPEDLFEETAENAGCVYNPDSDGEIVPEEEAPASETQNEAVSDEEKAAEVPEKPQEIDAADLKVNSDMQEIFSRLDRQNEMIEKLNKEAPPVKKIWHLIRDALGLSRPLNRWLLFGAAMFLLLLSLFSFRYNIARKFAWAEKVYTACGIECTILGEGLEFQNISRHEYEEDYIKKMQIKGFVVNSTAKDIVFPVIHVEVLDKDVSKLQELNVAPPVDIVKAGERVAFNVIITQPSPLSRHILLTFTK